MADPHNPATEEADHDAEAYLRGSMTIQEQSSTWTLFMNLAKWGSLFVAAMLLFLIMWFRPEGTFISGVIAGGGLAVAGWFFLRAKPAAH